MKTYIKIFIAVLLFTPVVASAQFTGISDLIRAVGGLINPLIGVLVGAALVVFLWGLAKFIFRVGGDEKAVDDGKRIMIWGLIALFVMVSVWGIISFIQSDLLPGGSSNSTPTGTGPLNPWAP